MSKQHKGKERRKSEAITKGLSKELLEVHNTLKKKFPDEYYPTSALREAKGDFSHHHDGNALDIRPSDEIYNFLMNTQEGLALMVKAGVGLYDETDPKNMRTATGLHFHIGKDSVPASVAKERYHFAADGELPSVAKSFKMRNPDFNYELFKAERDKKGVKNSKEDFSKFHESFMRDYEMLSQEDYDYDSESAGREYIKEPGEYLGPEEDDTPKSIDEEELTKKITAEIKRDRQIEELKKQEETEAQKRLREEENRKLSEIENIIAMSQQAIMEPTAQEDDIAPQPQQSNFNPIPEQGPIDIFEYPWDTPQAKYGGEIVDEEMELTDEEIEQYKKAGYKIDYL